MVVEDDLVDAMTIKRALREINFPNEVIIKENGEDALHFLQSEVTELPAMILLDLNMPRMNGIEFLKIIKNDDKLYTIPVVILTTSRSEQDKVESYKLGVAGYIVKSVNYQEFVKMVKTIKNYWDICELPV